MPAVAPSRHCRRTLHAHAQPPPCAQLARMAAGGAKRAPADLVQVVAAEAAVIVAELELTSPAIDATHSEVPDRYAGEAGLGNMFTPRSNSQKNPSSGITQSR